MVGSGGKNKFQELIGSTRPIPEVASKVSGSRFSEFFSPSSAHDPLFSGITGEMVKGKDSAAIVLNRWFDWLSSLTKSSSDVIVLVANFGLGTPITLLF